MNKQKAVGKHRVLLVEDHPLFRERVAHLINKDMGMTVCAEVDSIQDAMDCIQADKPDIAIVDISLHGSSGLELLKDIKAQGINLPVLILSMHEEGLYAERALRAGAKGYIMKNEAAGEIVLAIRRVMSGEVYVSNRINAKILQRVAQAGKKSAASGIDSLTDRELEVFQCIGKGRNSREIAESLHLGETTVETYRSRIREKLQIRNAAELYQRAAQWMVERGV